MNVQTQPSPNFDSRDDHKIDMLVLHYTGMRTAQEAIARLCDPAAKVSAHYVVNEDGAVLKMVEESERAWHAGVSRWRGHANINQRSIGIEIVNPGHEFGYRPFPQAQMLAVGELCKAILSRHAIPARNVVGHADIAPTRKEDPGEFFEWRWLAAQGVGLWPQESEAASESNADMLAAYGYDTVNLPAAITAFQRHFRPNLLNGKWDEECGMMLNALLDAIA